MLFTPGYLLIMIVSIGLGLATQAYIKSTVRKWGAVPIDSGLDGSQVARRILDAEGLHSVEIARVPGSLTDHYDPRSKQLGLSDDVFSRPTVAAAGVAAHEAGHAIQDAREYTWGRVRTAMVPAVNFGSSAAGILIVMGLFAQIPGLLWLGIAAYAIAVLFQLVTLPVEIDASRRAMGRLEQSMVMGPDQLVGARQVLTAAALTYVAAALISLLNLIYYLGLARRS